MSRSILFLALAMVSTGVAKADISYSVAGSTSTQNFDSLTSTTGAGITWNNDSTILGWHLFRQPGAAPVAISAYNAGTGASGTGSFYSLGVESNLDRALGGVGSGGTYFGSPASGSVAGWMAVSLVNDTGVTMTNLDIRYDGEQWRDGGNASLSTQTMVAQYGFGATFGGVTTWNNTGFDFTSPVATAVAGAINGNTTGLVANIGGTIQNVTWNNGSRLFIRWTENNDVGFDHGLAIDNFAFSASNVPEPSSLAFLEGIGVIGAIFARRRIVAKRKRA